MAALVALALAASPVCWTHYQVLQYPGVAFLLCYASRTGRWGLLAAAFTCGALLYPLPVAVLTDYCHEIRQMDSFAADVPLFLDLDHALRLAGLVRAFGP